MNILPIVFAAVVLGEPNAEGSKWIAKDVPHERGGLYALSYLATPRGAGTLTGGPDGFNMDVVIAAGETNEARHVSVYPAEADKLTLRLGTWSMAAGASWRDVTSCRVRPEYAAGPDGLELGAGEAIDGNVYRFTRRAFDIQGPHVRPYRGRRGCGYNSTRWCMSPGTATDYAFSLANRRFLSAEIALSVGHHTTGSVSVVVSRDGENWRKVLTANARDSFRGQLPPEVFPAECLHVRVVGDSPCSLQCGFPSLVAQIDGEPLRMAGVTRYRDAETGEVIGAVERPDYYDEDWGRRINAALPGGAVLWRADSGRHVAPWRQAPTDACKGLSVSAAANEAEAVQLVVKAGKSALSGVRVMPRGPFVTKDGARIDAAVVDVRTVGLVDVRALTDETSAPGLWPDPLEPQTADGLTVPAGENRAFWVRVKVPKGTAAGRYVGRLTVECRSDGSGVKRADVPFGIEVFGFELPDEMTLRTSFGFGRDRAFDYHGVTSAEDRRRVNDLYMSALSEAHLSPYKPFYGVPDWRCELKNGEFVFDWAAWDAGVEAVLKRYDFNTFVFAIPGITAGSFKKDTPHVFYGQTEGTPEYERLIAAYLKEIERHLTERGWIDVAYLYWFDEPVEHHYEWLKRGTAVVRRFAPTLRCMITKEPLAALDGAFNLWCPTSCNLHSPTEEACRRRGDIFWWYVCMLPKAPYATEFIDHPATDLRVWLWQTWKERISGILIWETVWWTSPSVYTKSRQNPYEDAASWADTGTGPGSFRYNWGNGDGRFLYPPRTCFAHGAKPVVEAPNGSVRLEMLRDGIEDYEYLAILSRLDPKHPLLEVPPEITRTLTDFAKTPEPIRERRRRVAEAISALTRGKAP